MGIICLAGGLLGTNTYIIPLEFNTCFVVDPSSPADRIAKQIKDMGMELSSIVLTHGHYDHMESLCSLKSNFPHALVYIHEEDSWALGSDSLEKHRKSFEESGLGDLYSEFYDADNAQILPEADFFLSEKLDFHKDWTVFHSPGHSPGSVCLYNEKDKLLISGDTLFYMGWGRTDLAGGDETKLMQSLKRLSLLPSDVQVFPGHGKYGFTMAENPIM